MADKKPNPKDYTSEAAYKRDLERFNRSKRNTKAVSDFGKSVVDTVKSIPIGKMDGGPRQPMTRKKSLTSKPEGKPGEWMNKGKPKPTSTNTRAAKSQADAEVKQARINKQRASGKRSNLPSTAKTKSKAKTKVSTPDTPPANNKVGPTTYAGKQPAQRGTPAQRKAKADHLAADIKSGKVKKGADPSKTASENPQIRKWKKESAATDAKLKKLRADAYKKSVDSSTNKAKIKKKDEAKKKAETKAKKAKTKAKTNSKMSINKKSLSAMEKYNPTKKKKKDPYKKW